jgi:hypothetical protein
MRRVVLALILLATTVASRAAAVADVQLVRVWPQWHDATFFSRISEYFTDVENTSGRIVARTHPAVRAGYYFLARVKHPAVGLENAKFVLRVIGPANPEPRVYTFPVNCPPGNHLFELGLTGDDWKLKGVHPVAWRLELLGNDGRVLVSQQSFLWSKPDK